MQEGHFHLSVKMVQRSKGRSATGAIAYRAGADITDERTGLRFNYKKKGGVSHSAIILPSGAPEKFKDRSTLWNAVEQRETRANSAVAREYECALPFDLPREMRVQLGLDFAQYIVERFGVAADINFHDPHPRDTWADGKASKNYHFHLLTSTRQLTSEGFGEKTRILDSAKTGSEVVEEIRAKFAKMTNDALAKHSLDKFVDHRSNERRGIQQEPQIHVGPNQNGERAELNAAIIAANSHIAQLERDSAIVREEIHLLLVDHTLPVGSILLHALEPRETNEAGSPSDDTIKPASRSAAPCQQYLGLTAPEPVAVMPYNGLSRPSLPQRVLGLDRVRRYRELEQLQKKAGTYGRAIEALRELDSDAASFQRELDSLERPGIMHKLLSTKRWHAYEQKKNELMILIWAAQEKVRRLLVIEKEYRQYQIDWDGFGWAEKKLLAKELGYETSIKIDLPVNARASYSLAGSQPFDTLMRTELA